ncbi:MAG: hypothetical protein FJ249_02415 [Nitrospira sp.]|nr:hypothetical protein [Nitrospira sp.]
MSGIGGASRRLVATAAIWFLLAISDSHCGLVWAEQKTVPEGPDQAQPVSAASTPPVHEHPEAKDELDVTHFHKNRAYY